MVNRNDNIKNESAYFYKVIKNMDTKEQIKQKKINEHELPLEEIFYSQFIDDPDWDKHLAEKTLLGWIELIENPKLHKALKDLPVEDQIFISYIVKECRTQKELSRQYNVAHQNISKRFNKILDKLRRLIK